MPGTYGPVIKPTSVSTRPTVGGSTTGAPGPGSSGIGVGIRLPFGYQPKLGGEETSKAKGGKVKKMAKGGSTASKRADGCCTKGKTKGKFV